MPPETRTCPVCWSAFTTSPRSTRIYCSKKCCGAAWERRGGRQPAPPAPPATPASPTADPQPTATCNCPHCGEPVTIVALLTTPQAARPRLPAQPPQVIPLRPARPV